MKKLTLFFLFFFSLSLSAAPMPIRGEKGGKHIFVNNKILARVNGKAISVIDTMKKMDMVFFQEFPQYASSTEARFEFYKTAWKDILRELIEKELILEDAKEIKIEVTRGDVRQELETLFGPNIFANLDKAGLTYKEAWELVKEELTIKKTMLSRVNAKATRLVTPSHIAAAYEEYALRESKPHTWTYQVISIRGEDVSLCAEAANHAYYLLNTKHAPLDRLQSFIESHSSFGGEISLSVSKETVQSEQEVSEDYRMILASLKPQTYSRPIVQQTRRNNSKVFRLFHLIDEDEGGAPPFAEAEREIKKRLMNEKIDESAGLYIQRLYSHFEVENWTETESFKNFQPFLMQ